MESWNPFFFFLPSIIPPVDLSRKSPTAQPKVFPSPKKTLTAPNLFPPDADANHRGTLGAALLNRLNLSSWFLPKNRVDFAVLKIRM
jgi:hypothetical protein